MNDTIDPRNLTQEPCPRCTGKQVWVYGRRYPRALRCSKAPRCTWRKGLAKKRPADWHLLSTSEKARLRA